MGSTYSLLKPLHSHFIRSSIVLVLFQGMGNVPSGKNDNVILKYVIAHMRIFLVGLPVLSSPVIAEYCASARPGGETQ